MTCVDTSAPGLRKERRNTWLETLARESFLEEVTLEPNLHMYVCAASVYSSKCYQVLLNASLSGCPLMPLSDVLHQESLLMGLAERRSTLPGRLAGIVRCPEKPGNL